MGPTQLSVAFSSATRRLWFPYGLVSAHSLGMVPIAPGGGGGRHFVNHQKIARSTHCTYCDRTFAVAYLLVDLDSTTLFPPGTDVIFIRSTKEPTLARVIVYSECGDEYRRITHRWGKNRIAAW